MGELPSTPPPTPAHRAAVGVPAGDAVRRAALAEAVAAHLPGAAAFVVDHDLRYVLALGEALGAVGVGPEQFVGRPVREVLDVLAPGLGAAAERLYRAALAGEDATHEHEQDGRAFLTRGVPLRGPDGAVEAALAVSYDVTERRAAEAAVRASESRFRALATASADVLYRMSPDWSEMRQLDGGGFLSDTPESGAAEPGGAWLGRYIHADDQAYVTAAIAEAVRTRSPFALEHRVIRADGTLGWTQSRAVPLVGADGAVTEWIGAASDVTARKAAEAALAASETRFRLAAEAARLYAWDADLAAKTATFSEDAGALLGYAETPDDWRDLATTFAALHPDDRDRVRDAVLAAVAGSGVFTAAYRLRTAAGDYCWVESRATVQRDAEGRPARMHGVVLDVDARVRSEAALRASEARVRALVDNVRDYAIFGLDAEGRVTEWPAGAERVKGYPAAEAIGLPLAAFYTPEDRAAGVPERHLAEAAATGRGEWEGWRVRKDGTRFWANEIATAVHDAAGRVVGFTKISRDLTERRLADEVAEQAQLAAARDELRRALAAAEEGERRRLARELHDQLGQHLTGFALGLADTRRRLAGALGAATPDAAVRSAEAGLERLEELARLMTRDARNLALELRPPELDDVGLVSAIDTYVRAWGERTGVAAELVVTGLHEREVPADTGSALYRIVQEALTNVAKHAGARQVSVIVEQPDGEVGLIVEDDGRGFDADAVDARVRRERRLGLAGMRERAALAGGTVAVESSPGGGTTVYARLPLHHPVPPPPRRPPTAPAHPAEHREHSEPGAERGGEAGA